MENNTNNTNQKKTGIFSLLYRTRLLVTKGNSQIINLSVLFSIIALLCAPWLVIIGAIVALVLGYHFSIDRNAAEFDRDFENVVKDAADNVKHVVENVTGTHQDETGENHGDNNQGTDAQA